MKTLLQFVCEPCGRRFDAEGRRVEWSSSLYGPCHEMLADCPDCGKPAKEYRVKSSSASSAESAECGGGACAQGDLSAGAFGGGGMGGGGCSGCPCG